VAAQALATFENVKRRMEVRGQVRGITVYDDFAHHPTAIRTTIDGLRRQVGAARILAVFEPRSNTMKLGTMKSQLPWSLEAADLAFCHSGGLGWDAAEALNTPADIAAYLDAYLEDGSPEELLRALNTIARSRGMSALARDTGISREALYKAFSDNGNPTLDTLLRVMKALGVRLAVAA
jgi:probable addiction module antidote protein